MPYTCHQAATPRPLALQRSLLRAKELERLALVLLTHDRQRRKGDGGELGRRGFPEGLDKVEHSCRPQQQEPHRNEGIREAEDLRGGCDPVARSALQDHHMVGANESFHREIDGEARQE